MIHAIGLLICNVGSKPTFQRGASESINDITFASTSTAARLRDWDVLDENLESHHNYIYYSIDKPSMVASHKPKGWVIGKLDQPSLHRHNDNNGNIN